MNAVNSYNCVMLVFCIFGRKPHAFFNQFWHFIIIITVDYVALEFYQILSENTRRFLRRGIILFQLLFYCSFLFYTWRNYKVSSVSFLSLILGLFTLDFLLIFGYFFLHNACLFIFSFHHMLLWFYNKLTLINCGASGWTLRTPPMRMQNQWLALRFQTLISGDREIRSKIWSLPDYPGEYNWQPWKKEEEKKEKKTYVAHQKRSCD